MKAWILNVGNEVISGKVLNTNSVFLAQNLRKLGILTAKTVVVGDDEEMLNREFRAFQESDADLLITTGGLGPTHDDLTKETLAKSLNLKLVRNAQAEKLLNDYFGSEMAKCNWKQADFPEGSFLIENRIGTADGAIIEADKKTYILLVGPPIELEPMVYDTVLPYLQKKSHSIPFYQDYIVMGNGESFFEELLMPLYRKYPTVSIAPYAGIGKIRYEIFAYEKDFLNFEHAKADFEALMADYIISKTNEDIETVVVNILKDCDYSISFAESITGGMLAAKIVNVPGASLCLNESYITYSNEAKTKLLGVKPETLNVWGAVSEAVVREMAEGLYERTHSDICVSISGIAGPAGGSIEKPVGLVHYAIRVNGNTISEQKVFRGNRDMIRTRTCLWILYRIFMLLKKQ